MSKIKIKIKIKSKKPSRSQQPAAVDFDHIQFSTPPITICGQAKSLRGAVERNQRGLLRVVRVVSLKADGVSRFDRLEQDHAVVDGQLGKQHQMDDGRFILPEGGNELCRGARLVRARDGE